MLLSAHSLPRSLWFLDFDGTLCPHLEAWESRSYDPQGILDLLKSLEKKSAGVFWNTGRRPESLFSVFPSFQEISGFFVQGTYFWDASKAQLVQLAPFLNQEWLDSTAKLLESDELFTFEQKPTSARVAPKRSQEMHHLADRIQQLPSAPQGWIWHIGHRGAELLHQDFNKGQALEWLKKKQIWNKEFIPVAAGDDSLDRSAVEWALKQGGMGILVGPHCSWGEDLKSNNMKYFDEPFELHNFLEKLLIDS